MGVGEPSGDQFMLWIWRGRILFPPFLLGEFVTFGSGCGSWSYGEEKEKSPLCYQPEKYSAVCYKTL